MPQTASLQIALMVSHRMEFLKATYKCYMLLCFDLFAGMNDMYFLISSEHAAVLSNVTSQTSRMSRAERAVWRCDRITRGAVGTQLKSQITSMFA